MRSDLDHLPAGQQQELARIRSTLLEEFDAARTSGAGGTSEWRRRGKVLKIILFGSYARDDWVDEPKNGYQSDYDLLVIVSHEKLTDVADYWWTAEDKILRDPAIGRTVNLIVHDLGEVNAALARGEYFWTDISRDGVVLHDVPGHPLAVPKPASPNDAYDLARSYHQQKIAQIDLWLTDAQRHVNEASKGQHHRQLGAFQLHQAVEAAYVCLLLVRKLYAPRSHNIKFLRSLAEDVDKQLVEAWPREHRIDRRRFELLKRAYVEARYSDQFDASAEDLDWLITRARHLRDLVADLGHARIEELKAQAGAARLETGGRTADDILCEPR